MRVHLYNGGRENQFLLFAVHHLVADLRSIAVIWDELRATYNSEPVDITRTPSRDYTEFVSWQSRFLAGSGGARSWQHWKGELEGELPVIRWADTTRRRLQPAIDRSVQWQLDRDQLQAGRTLCRREGVTLYHFLVAAAALLIHRHTGIRDVVIGIAPGRTRAEWARMVGYFANPIALRFKVTAHESFRSFLAHTSKITTAGLAHQDFPFAAIVERLRPDRQAGRAPLIQTCCMLQTLPDKNSNLPLFSLGRNGDVLEINDSLALISMALPKPSVEFDLLFRTVEASGGLIGVIEYSADLFERETVERMAEQYCRLLAGAAAEPDRRVSAIPLLSGEERRQIVEEWNSTAADSGASRCVHEWIEEQTAEHISDNG